VTLETRSNCSGDAFATSRWTCVASKRFDVRHLPPGTCLLLGAPAWAPGCLLAIISRTKNASFDRAHAVTGPGREGDDDHEAITEECLPRYEQALRARRSLDFDDLVVRPAALLEGDVSLRESYRERFRHVLVDEYRDTNRVQFRLLELLRAAEPGAGGAGAGGGSRRGSGRASDWPVQDGWSGRSLCSVGDDDQAIYGWRGAEVRNILRFEKHFPGAAIIRPEQNYRSTGRILDCANAVIARSAERRPKRLWTDAGPGDPVRVIHLPGED
jgi:DNA helicase-2/ATP-dependent DNA helicase PcrA